MINEREIRDALDQLAADDDVERRWDDVLRRAAEPPRRRRRRRRGVLAAVAFAVAAPAIAAGAFQLLQSDAAPIVARGHVEDRSLSFSADLRGRPSTFTHAPTTGQAFGTRDFRWTLTIEEPAARRVKAELVVAGRRPVALCDPCRSRSGGLAPPIRALWLNIADKHVQLRISVAGKTLSAPLRLAR